MYKAQVQARHEQPHSTFPRLFPKSNSPHRDRKPQRKMLFKTLASLCLLVTASVAAPGGRSRQATRDSVIRRSYDAAAEALEARQARTSPSSAPLNNNYCYGFPKGLPPLENHAIYPDRVGVLYFPTGGKSNTFPNVPDVDTCITICTRETARKSPSIRRERSER